MLFPLINTQDHLYDENFIEEEEYEEEEYLDDPIQQRSRGVDNNNYMMEGYDENAQMNDDYELYPDDNNQHTYEDMNKVENRDIMHNRNDTNNNANGELYGYQHQQQFDVDQQMKNKTNLAINNNISEEEYYEEMYEDDVKMMKNSEDHHNYEEEFDNEYAHNSVTSAAAKQQQQQQQHVQKQMSILSEDAHQHDEYMNDKTSMMNDEQRALHDEYLDEFPEDEHVLQQKMNNAASIMRKQESVMEDDPELKHLEEKQNQKNQQMQQQQQHNDFYPDHVKDTLDPFDIGVEVKRKKSVTIITDGDLLLPEKPRLVGSALRSAKQRWHWAYNRIVHQARVSKSLRIFLMVYSCVH